MELAERRFPLLMMGLGLAAGCVAPADIEEIKSNQKKILAGLEEIKSRPVAPPRPERPPEPGRPEPTAVYSYEVGDSPSKGPANAWVTVIEVSDFQ